MSENERIPWWTCWIDDDGEPCASKWFSETQARNDKQYHPGVSVVVTAPEKPSADEITELIEDAKE